ncbi:unnamed protein product [Phaedon cochleariae]|uniref:CUB domain-containing protein n=1 Tax=Phaedon cochleariae TaxID=80249 RepID=A0A9P0GP08_PHACE|nr:unnamed protein product [Phaedon cochleariae]
MFLFLWILIFGYFRLTNSGYVEIVEAIGCHSCNLLLTCRHLTSIIAILEVDFYPDLFVEESAEENPVESLRGNGSQLFAGLYPRDVLNQRCSGLNHCSFVYSEDCLDRNNSVTGNVTVKYACITEDRIKKYCNSVIVLPTHQNRDTSEGFIHNPGYPRFYSGHKECRWAIKGAPQQRIRVAILDISLIVDNVGSQDCTDVLEIRDSGQVIHSSCRQQHPPTEIISATESIEVVLSSRHEFNPRRGFLIRYSIVGCSDIDIPQDVYVVYRNYNSMVLSCCVGYQFPDTGTRTRTISCLGAFWNTSLPLLDCQSEYTQSDFYYQCVDFFSDYVHVFSWKKICIVLLVHENLLINKFGLYGVIQNPISIF